MKEASATVTHNVTGQSSFGSDNKFAHLQMPPREADIDTQQELSPAARAAVLHQLRGLRSYCTAVTLSAWEFC